MTNQACALQSKRSNLRFHYTQRPKIVSRTGRAFVIVTSSRFARLTQEPVPRGRLLPHRARDHDGAGRSSYEIATDSTMREIIRRGEATAQEAFARRYDRRRKPFAVPL